MVVSGAGGRLTHTTDTAEAAAQGPQLWAAKGGQNPKAGPQNPPVPPRTPGGPAAAEGVSSALGSSAAGRDGPVQTQRCGEGCEGPRSGPGGGKSWFAVGLPWLGFLAGCGKKTIARRAATSYHGNFCLHRGALSEKNANA